MIATRRSAPTNLEVLKRSRKRPEIGDIFVMLPPNGKYLFGRVIRTDALGPMKALLIYIYANLVLLGAEDHVRAAGIRAPRGVFARRCERDIGQAAAPRAGTEGSYGS